LSIFSAGTAWVFFVIPLSITAGVVATLMVRAIRQTGLPHVTGSLLVLTGRCHEVSVTNNVSMMIIPGGVGLAILSSGVFVKGKSEILSFESYNMEMVDWHWVRWFRKTSRKTIFPGNLCQSTIIL